MMMFIVPNSVPFIPSLCQDRLITSQSKFPLAFLHCFSDHSLEQESGAKCDSSDWVEEQSEQFHSEFPKLEIKDRVETVS